MKKMILSVCAALLTAAVFLPVAAIAGRQAPRSSDRLLAASAKLKPFCDRLGHSIQASTGAQMLCFGAQQNGALPPIALNINLGSNVNAASPKEDRSPAGVQAYGQSEESVAASGPYVVEAWNDSTGFVSPCPAPKSKEELTGFGFSSDGGATFHDMGGLPNAGCATSIIAGDPSVEAYTVGGETYFYITSIFIPFSIPENDLSVTACHVVAGPTLSCSQPIIAAISSQCNPRFGCSFLDKEFLSIDPVRARLYMSYTEFGSNFSKPLFNGAIELSVCDLSSPATPACYNGSAGSSSPPYLVVSRPDPNCEREGAYPAVDLATGDVYVAHEFNWESNIFNPACFGTQTTDILQRIPGSCLTIPVATCTPAAFKQTAAKVVSMDANFIPGYNRFPASDFPRVAVSDTAGTVSMVWNDAVKHVMGDILLQSFHLGTLSAVHSPVVLNQGSNGGLHFLPALRNVDEDGMLNVTWYQRDTANTTITDVYGAIHIDPRISSTPASSTLITTGPTDWNAVSSDIVPNFGDYTDNYVIATDSAPYTNETLYVAWADGRLGEPQPFEDHLETDPTTP